MMCRNKEKESGRNRENVKNINTKKEREGKSE